MMNEKQFNELRLLMGSKAICRNTVGFITYVGRDPNGEVVINLRQCKNKYILRITVIDDEYCCHGYPLRILENEFETVQLSLFA